MDSDHPSTFIEDHADIQLWPIRAGLLALRQGFAHAERFVASEFDRDLAALSKFEDNEGFDTLMASIEQKRAQTCQHIDDRHNETTMLVMEVSTLLERMIRLPHMSDEVQSAMWRDKIRRFRNLLEDNRRFLRATYPGIDSVWDCRGNSSVWRFGRFVKQVIEREVGR